MKFSGSLLGNNDIGIKIFNNSIVKTKNLLKDVFGLDFDGADPNINKIDEDKENFRYGVVFTLNGREIAAEFTYEAEDFSNDIVTEMLCISEYTTEDILLPEAKSAGGEDKKLFWENVKGIQDYLENRFELNYTPLDPEEKDKNIISAASDEERLTWVSIFTQDHQEGSFEVKYNFVAGHEQKVKLVHHKQHKIFLD